MKSKAAVFACLLFLLSVLVFSSAASEANQDDKAAEVRDVNPEESKQVHGCRRGCCSYFRGRCVRCCPASAIEAQSIPNENAVGGVNPEESKQNQRCRRGCCRYYSGRCVRCCPSAAEAVSSTSNVDAEQGN